MPGLHRGDARIDDRARRHPPQAHADELAKADPRTARPGRDPEADRDQPDEQHEDDDEEKKNQGDWSELHGTSFLGCIGDAHDDACPFHGHDFDFLMAVDVFTFGHHIDLFRTKANTPDRPEWGDGDPSAADRVRSGLPAKAFALGCARAPSWRPTRLFGSQMSMMPAATTETRAGHAAPKRAELGPGGDRARRERQQAEGAGDAKAWAPRPPR